MVAALRRGDNAGLVELMDIHRDITVADLSRGVLVQPARIIT
jgi:hypothetical protein